eukprot:c13509_g1_i1 orf=78-830(+)
MADRGLSDLFSSASSLLNSQSHSSSSSQGHGQKPPSSSSAQEGNGMPHSTSHAHKPSYDEIYSSAQVVFNAAKTKLQKPSSSSPSPSSEDVSMGKLAGAAGTLIGAVAHYGKIEETGYGKYAQKAQEYLQSYEMKHGKPGTSATQSSAHHSSSDQNGHSSSTYATSEVSHSQPSAPPYPADYHSQPSAAPQGYPAGYPPQGYPDAQQGYGYASQGHNKPAQPNVNVESYPPVGYPPEGYPTVGGRPTKYS